MGKFESLLAARKTLEADSRLSTSEKQVRHLSSTLTHASTL
jgi:hypothetical protein